MANYEPGFANENTSKRFPTAQEIAEGFPCGPLDLALFNMLFNQIQEELGEVITWGGIAHTNDRNTLVREAIQAKLTSYLISVGGLAGENLVGGDISLDGNRRYTLKMSDGIVWRLQLPPQVIAGFTNKAVFTSSGNWAVPSGITCALVTCIGGGGGGSGGRGNVSPGNTVSGWVAGGGGGGGGYGQTFINSLAAGQSVPVTVGAGGGGSAYQASANSIGGAGGTSSFAFYLSATGGNGASNQRGGGGGGGAGGDVNFSLGAGEYAATQGDDYGKGGAGGGGTQGNGTGQVNGSDGGDATIIGAGGAGASYGGGTGATGGDGKSGSVTIYY